jgi:hypothetical protein
LFAVSKGAHLGFRPWDTRPRIGKESGMSSENTPGDVSPTVQLFQRAHQKMTQLGRIDEQVGQLLARRRALQDELRAVQAEINEEFDRQLRPVEDVPTSGNGKPLRPTLEHVVRRSVQFAGEPIENAANVG